MRRKSESSLDEFNVSEGPQKWKKYNKAYCCKGFLFALTLQPIVRLLIVFHLNLVKLSTFSTTTEKAETDLWIIHHLQAPLKFSFISISSNQGSIIFPNEVLMASSWRLQFPLFSNQRLSNAPAVCADFFFRFLTKCKHFWSVAPVGTRAEEKKAAKKSWINSTPTKWKINENSCFSCHKI